jgi:23S rRNA pseudouridine1911/1915/1917 synthase
MEFKDWIIYEDKSCLAINKPSGLIVEKNPFEHPSVEDLAWAYLQSQTKRPFLGIVHRLDRVTSGVLIFAKKKTILRLLNQQFAEKTIQKTYFALVANRPKTDTGTLLHWLEKDQLQKRAVIHEQKQANTKEAILTYQVINKANNLILLELHPKTGRFHQIRAQLAHINCPIVGDEKYGSIIEPAHRKIALHAGKLTFLHPETQQKITLKAPLPNRDYWLNFSEISH